MSWRTAELVRRLYALNPPPDADGRDRTDRAALAALRRALGQPIGSVVEVYRYVPELAVNDDASSWTAAALFGWHPMRWPRTEDAKASPPAQGRDYGQSLARLARALQRRGQASDAADQVTEEVEDAGGVKIPPALERRVMALLAADADDLHHHLRSLMGLLRQEAVPVDWQLLIRHMRAWDAEERWVQRRWARSFWASSLPANSPSLPAQDETIDQDSTEPED